MKTKTEQIFEENKNCINPSSRSKWMKLFKAKEAERLKIVIK